MPNAHNWSTLHDYLEYLSVNFYVNMGMNTCYGNKLYMYVFIIQIQEEPLVEQFQAMQHGMTFDKP